MKNENDTLLMNNNINDLGYTSVGDKSSGTKTIFTRTLPKLVNDIQNKTFEDVIDNSDSVQGDGLKIIVPSNTIDIYTRLEILLGNQIIWQHLYSNRSYWLNRWIIQ